MRSARLVAMTRRGHGQLSLWTQPISDVRKSVLKNVLHATEESIYICDELFILFIFLFFLPSRGTSPWFQGINPSLPGTCHGFRSRGLSQHSRTASTHEKQTQLITLFTHILTLSTVGIRHYEGKTQRISNRTLDFPTLRATVGRLHHQGAADG